LLAGTYLPIEIFAFVLIGTLILLVSRRRSKIAMWVLIAWFVLSLAGFLASLVQSVGGLLGPDIVRVISAVLQFIGQGVALGLLFTPSPRQGSTAA
jgi:Na+/H+ antiporter NhaB